MARIFISYASEDADIAEALGFSLRSLGHTVFVDRDSLDKGHSYDRSLNSELRKSDAICFLVSCSFVSEGRFTHTEVEWAREKFPAPSGRVFPVKIDDVSVSQIPAYLRAVTLISPKGNIVAETVNIVEDQFGKPGWSSAWLTLGFMGLLAAPVGFLLGRYGIWDVQDTSGTMTELVAFLRSSLVGPLLGVISGYAVWRWYTRSLAVWMFTVALFGLLWGIADNLSGWHWKRPFYILSENMELHCGVEDENDTELYLNMFMSPYGWTQLIGDFLILALSCAVALAFVVTRFRSPVVWFTFLDTRL